MTNGVKIPGFEEIYKKYHDRIFRYLYRLTDNWEDSRDLAQDAFIKVNANLSKFKGQSSISTWIYKIATNVAYDRFRSASFQKIKKGNIEKELDEKQKVIKNVWETNEDLSLEDQIARKEMNECINRFIYDLNENYRTILILSEYEGLKNREIADILGITIDTVKIRIHRGRTQLRKKMEKGCIITPDPQGGLFCDEK